MKWLRSQGFAAAYIGQSNDKDRNIIDGQGKFNFVYWSPESGDSRFREKDIMYICGWLFAADRPPVRHT